MKPFNLRFAFSDLPLATAQDKSGAVWNLDITADGTAVTVTEYDAAGPTGVDNEI